MLDEILEGLVDGKSHSLKEVLAYVRNNHHTPIPSKKQVQLALSLLKKYGFVNYFNDGSQKFWFLDKKVAEFLRNIKKME